MTVDRGGAHEPHPNLSPRSSVTLRGHVERRIGMVVVLSSPQNVDRAVTAYRAALRAGRDVAVDLYSADVLEATGRPTIPRVHADWPRMRAFVPLHQRVKVKDAGTVRPSRGGEGTACLRRRSRRWIGVDGCCSAVSTRDPSSDPHPGRSRGSGGVVDVGGYLDEPSGVRLRHSRRSG